MRVQIAPPEHHAWLFERIGYWPSQAGGFSAIEAIDSGGDIRGMVGWDTWTPNSVHLHVALENPLAARWLFEPTFAFPFCDGGRRVVLGVVPGDRLRVLKLARRFGFVEIAQVRDGWKPGVPLVMLELRRENCAWPNRAREVA